MLEGAVQAIMSVVFGTVLGAISFVSFPIIGALQAGLTGLIAGGIVGSIVGFLTTISGLVNGVIQLLRGTLGTWHAIQAFSEGKIWSPVNGKWCEYSIGDEAKELSSTRKQSTVKDETYYEILEVAFDASSKEIKRAYFRLAKVYHPDKNPDDEGTAEKFLKLHTAYQTLMDDDLRAAYDTFGAIPENGGRPMDPYVFFAILFGSQLVEPFIGELAVASLLDFLIKLTMMESATLEMNDLKILWDDSEFKSRKRQLEIAQNLVSRIERFVDGAQSASEFKEQCFLEAGDIGQTAFGTRFLASIGTAFKLEAGQYLSYHISILTLPIGLFNSANRWKNKIRNRIRTLCKTVTVIQSTLQQTETTEDSASSRRLLVTLEDIHELLPVILEMAWAYNELDIAHTVHGACWRIFLDSDVTSHERLRRAEAIQIMGKEFVRLSHSVANAKTCTDSPVEASEIMARLEVAFKLAQQKVCWSYYMECDHVDCLQ